ncbi:uncharacterized protein CTRU02_211778 [Colletotrichum truncatum]|uniref:Uncharacterized protein n=1 Tax=Colletotrichum truncatum TaxID=5467 RepID=A0ACC3YLN5_COLTU|nr:uncharacterized protein CTRU02_07187 [Colletotrichum truncatum]KAF6791425.1 hypothetical protein CTRU02_07187 [Colletotrichum truncatum]
MSYIEVIEDGGPPGIAPRGQAVIVCSAITAALSGVIVGLRFFARLSPARLLGKEDWCILIAWVWSVLEAIGMCIQVRTGMGERFYTLSLYQQQTFFKWSYITIIFYNCGLAFVKVSILLLYLRVLRDLQYRKACYVALCFVILVSLWAIISSIVACVPIQRNWDLSVPGRCIDRGAHWFGNAGLNIATDFTILILPLPILPKIKQPRQQKIGLYLIFALGFFVCIVSILRIPSLVAAQNSTDPTYDSPGIAQWSVVELNTAIVCASLITLKPLATRFCPRIMGLLGSDNGLQRGAQSGSGNDAAPATVGSRKSGLRVHHTTISDGSMIQLHHDPLGATSAAENQNSRQSFVEPSDVEQGLNPIMVQESPAAKKSDVIDT